MLCFIFPCGPWWAIFVLLYIGRCIFWLYRPTTFGKDSAALPQWGGTSPVGPTVPLCNAGRSGCLAGERTRRCSQSRAAAEPSGPWGRRGDRRPPPRNCLGGAGWPGGRPAGRIPDPPCLPKTYLPLCSSLQQRPGFAKKEYNVNDQ